MTVHVLYENSDWLPPVIDALHSRGLDVVEHFVDGGSIDLAELPPQGLYLNRMSPSSHTRGHQGGVVFMKEYLAYLESHGRRIINGSEAFAMEVSKVRQHAALEAFGIRTPHTVAVIGAARMSKAARKLAPPFITKHNQGGKGLGVQLFRSHDSLDALLASGGYEGSPDGIDLLQQYIEPPEPFITRVEIVDGRFLYALRSSTEQGFQLCPADACQLDDQFCPVGESGPDDRFSIREDITAADPLVRQLIAFCRAHRIDVAGIEFVEDAQGNRYTYDINGTTNYNGDVEEKNGLHGMGAIADLCLRALLRRVA
ncbi:MAG: hypothetical protein ACI8S6_006013 [Myxococcota bacterium]|jgi:hypothetical protein